MSSSTGSSAGSSAGQEEKTAKIEEQINNQKKYIEEIRASATNTKRKAIQSVFLESLKREQRKQRRRARSAQKKEEKKKAKREKRRKKYREAKINEKTNCTKSKGTAIRAIYIELKKLTKEEEAQRK
jgi:hypothetical protein